MKANLIIITKFILKAIITIYFCAVLGYILCFIGNKNYLIDAFSPAILINELLSGNTILIEITVLGTIFIYRFNSLRRQRVDYWTGGRAWPWGPWEI
jgi:hypothetical protein